MVLLSSFDSGGVMKNDKVLLEAGDQELNMNGVNEEFMDLMFTTLDRPSIMNLIADMSLKQFSYILTPNTDGVVNFATEVMPSSVWHEAGMLICDSRIVALLARLRGLTLTCYPGSDIVADMLGGAIGDRIIAVVGPDQAEFDELRRRYPDQHLVRISSSLDITPGTLEWDDCINACMDTQWDILLACISSPKQDMIVREIRARGGHRGVALCVGASVNFLTGRQKRAPRFIQVMALEWLYRLASDPKRLWRRYLVKGPKILPHYVRTEVLR